MELLFYTRLLGKDIGKKITFSTEADKQNQIRGLKDFGYIHCETYDKKRNEKVFTLTDRGFLFALWIIRQTNSPKRFKQLLKANWGKQFHITKRGIIEFVL